jgi:hypothetical protein
MKKCHTASNHSDNWMTGMKNSIRLMITTAALLAASPAFADIDFLPSGSQYIDPGIAQANIQIGDESFTYTVRTSGLTGELTIRGSDFPPEYDIATTAQAVLPFEQELELVINVAEGTISGRSTGNFLDMASANVAFTAEVHGNASCLPLNGRECGQLVVDLELRGVLSDPNDPASVGQLRMEILGSLVWDDTNVAHWAAMSANTTIGGNEGLINSLSRWMGDANLDGE